MGLTTGHVFSDGDTVTAVKLNAMVNDATIDNATITPSMIEDDAIETRHISDGAITSNHLTSGAVSIGAVESGQTTEGYLIQTDSNGDLTTLNVGASGTVLVSGGAETAPSFTTVGAAGINAAMISDHDKLESPDVSDLVFAKSISDGVNKRIEMQDIYRTVSGLTELSSSDIADADEFLVLDGGVPKKISRANLIIGLSVGSADVYRTSDVETVRSSGYHLESIGYTPEQIRVTLLCETTDSATGYAAGDELEIGHNFWSNTGENRNAVLVIYDAASQSVRIQFESDGDANGYRIQHKTGGNTIDVNATILGNFAFKIRTWR